MANSSAGFGAVQFGRREGGAPTAGLTKVVIASSDTTAVFTGDVVQDSSTDGRYVTLSTSGLGVSVINRGVFLGCEYYDPVAARPRWSPYFPGSVQTSSGTADVTAYICDDGDELYIAKGSTSGALTSSFVGLNIGFMSSMGGNTLDGRSRMVLASSMTGSTGTLPFRVVDFYSNCAPPGTLDGIDNTSVGNIVVVKSNAIGRSLTARAS